jgi:NAD(P)-dependent dehydrogenase (short-subunit alcohol dehydrogenase family)
MSPRHALVTGGGAGIGGALALALADAGVQVTICGRRPAPLDAVTAERAGRIFAIPADVTDPASLAALYETAEAARGAFDIVVANAGAAISAPAHRIALSDWNVALAVNLTGAFLTVQPALKGMRERGWGRIVFIASTAGLKGYPYVAAYVAAKHGVIGLMRALAAETATSGITVNAICPGFTDTPMLTASVQRIVGETGRSEAEARAALAGNNPQGRFIEADEIAGALIWLISEGARSVTGQAISISGGETG